MMVQIAVIGAGLIGKERLRALHSLRRSGFPVSISAICDPESSEAANLARQYSARLLANVDEVIAANPDWVFIATPHDVAVEMALKCVKKRIPVFVEKPFGRSYSEARQLTALADPPARVFVGYNYRFLDGIGALMDDVCAGLFGELISVNMTLGHGHNPDMSNSWKLNPQKAGGGCLIDPGVHLLDLCCLLSGAKLQVLAASSWSGFWKTGVEEECHVLLKAESGFTINLQLSIVHWRSTFFVEVNGTKGYGRVTGRGRSFGPQQYIRGKRWGWLEGKTQAESEILVCETDATDVFLRETEALLFPKPGDRQHVCTLRESLDIMELLDRCWRCAGISQSSL